MTLPQTTAQQPPSKSALTSAQRRGELWRRGVVVRQLGHDVQKRMADDIAKSVGKKYVINSARRLGKSFLLCCLAIEYALQHDNAQIKYAAETQRSVKKIIIPLFRQILETCPKDLRPKFHSHDGVYTFANGAEIHIAGSALDQADSLRGTACDLAIVDEAGFCDALEYLVDSVLLPQTMGRPNARIILASTPPKSPDNSFVTKYMAAAMADGNYSRYTIYDNPRITPAEIAEFMKEAGGEDSTTWRREYLAEVVTDRSSALFPEATDVAAMDALIQDIPLPSHYIPIVAMDLGYIDYTGVLFGYYHFQLGKIIIQDEILVNKNTSAQIVALIKAKETEIWGKIAPRTRVVDGNALAIADLNATHRLACHVPDKTDLSASVNRVRMDLASGNVLFNPRCLNTIAQVRYATWDVSRTKFSRNSSGGHWDLVAALLYLCRHIDRVSNPYPAGYGFDKYTHFGFPTKHVNTAAEQFKRLFPRLRK